MRSFDSFLHQALSALVVSVPNLVVLTCHVEAIQVSR